MKHHDAIGSALQLEHNAPACTAGVGADAAVSSCSPSSVWLPVVAVLLGLVCPGATAVLAP